MTPEAEKRIYLNEDDANFQSLRADRNLLLYEIHRLRAELTVEREKPIDMLLFCPDCGEQHIDAPDERTPDWTNPPHRKHLCHHCQHVWKPCDRATNGIAALQVVAHADQSPIPQKYALERAESERLRAELRTMTELSDAQKTCQHQPEPANYDCACGEECADGCCEYYKCPTCKLKLHCLTVVDSQEEARKLQAEVGELTAVAEHCGRNHTEHWLAQMPTRTHSDQAWRDRTAALEETTRKLRAELAKVNARTALMNDVELERAFGESDEPTSAAQLATSQETVQKLRDALTRIQNRADGILYPPVTASFAAGAAQEIRQIVQAALAESSE